MTTVRFTMAEGARFKAVLAMVFARFEGGLFGEELFYEQYFARTLRFQSRLDLFERRFFEAYPEIEQKDPERAFSHEQRLAIFRRDEGLCQLRLACNGDRVTWGHWHADHRVPHTLGGKSIVANGQVACIPCNLAKGMQVHAAELAEPVS